MVLDHGKFRIVFVEPSGFIPTTETLFQTQFDTSFRTGIHALRTNHCDEFMTVAHLKLGIGAGKKAEVCSRIAGNSLHKLLAVQPRAAARRLGLPVMIKAAAGGGGRGMRLVERAEELLQALAAAHREAQAAFGSGALLLERYLPEIHHVEVQVLADEHGGVSTLGERDCSVQRRHQKIIEEAPSPCVNPAWRAQITAAAAAVARAAGYVNAGTVEFLVDAAGQFYFLEVNTRLQVEHPVTEAVTGVDLVKAQLRIASGAPLDPEPAPVRGHAIECRVYAEDPADGFVPSPGPVWALDEPAGPGIRIDSGLRTGWRVPVAYDPLLAKVIVWDRTRPEAVARMAEALRRYVILGCTTNLNFLEDVVGHEAFVRGDTTTRFLEQHLPSWGPGASGLQVAAAAALEALFDEQPGAAPPGGRVATAE